MSRVCCRTNLPGLIFVILIVCRLADSQIAGNEAPIFPNVKAIAQQEKFSPSLPSSDQAIGETQSFSSEIFNSQSFLQDVIHPNREMAVAETEEKSVKPHSTLEGPASVDDSANGRQQLSPLEGKAQHEGTSGGFEKDEIGTSGADEDEEDPFASVDAIGNDEVLGLLRMVRSKPKVSKKALQVLQDLGGRASPALHYAVHHPEGPEYHEVPFGAKDNTSYVETHIVSLPDGFDDNLGICRLVLNIDSPIFKLSPAVSVIVSSLLRTIVSPAGSDLSLNVTEYLFHPTITVTGQGSCEEGMKAILRFSRLAGDFGPFSLLSDHYGPETRNSMFGSFNKHVQNKVQKAKKASTLHMKGIFNEMIRTVALQPYFSFEDIVQVEEEVFTTDWLSLAELAREFVAESLFNAHVSVLAVGHFTETTKPSKSAILEWAGFVGSGLGFTKIKPIDCLNNFRKVEWLSAPHSVVVEKSVNLRDAKITSITGISYQIFEDDVIGIKRHECGDLLKLDAIAAIGRSLASSLLSDIGEFETNTDLSKAMKSLGIQSIDFDLGDIYDETLFLNIYAVSTVSESREVEPELRKFIAYLNTILKNLSQEELNKRVATANWSPEVLLFQHQSKSSFDLLADFYSAQITRQVYEFERPLECSETFSLPLDTQSVVELWDKYLSDSTTTRSITVRLDNSRKDIQSPQITADLSIDEPATQHPAMMNATIRTAEDIVRFIRSRSLLPSSSVLSSIAIHERFIKGWEGES